MTSCLSFFICLVQLSCLWKLLAFSFVVLEENKLFHYRASANRVVDTKKELSVQFIPLVSPEVYCEVIGTDYLPQHLHWLLLKMDNVLWLSF